MIERHSTMPFSESARSQCSCSDLREGARKLYRVQRNTSDASSLLSLLPCRHVMAANLAAFTNTFQPGQFHPRWLANFEPSIMSEMLLNQFWIKPKER